MTAKSAALLTVALGLILVLAAAGCGDEADSRMRATAPAGDEGLLAPQAAPALLGRLERRLDLTADQMKQIRDILARERQAFRGSGLRRQDPDKAREMMRAHREQVADQIATVLTPEQKTKFDALREQRRALTADGVGDGQVLAKRLSLDEAQKARLTTLITQRREAMKGVRQSVKDGRMTRPAARELARAERQKFRRDLESILTPEQKARLATLMEERRGDHHRARHGW